MMLNFAWWLMIGYASACPIVFLLLMAVLLVAKQTTPEPFDEDLKADFVQAISAANRPDGGFENRAGGLSHPPRLSMSHKTS